MSRSSPEFQRRALEVFEAIVELDPTAREAYLGTHCSDPELQKFVIELLQADAQSGVIERLAIAETYEPANSGMSASMENTVTERPHSVTAHESPLYRSDQQSSLAEIVAQIEQLGLASESQLSEFRKAAAIGNVQEFGRTLLENRVITAYQWCELTAGRGERLRLGNYLIVDKLGQGGMGLVLKAEHRRMKRVVALKVLSPEIVHDSHSLTRFQREVEAAARLTHPNIVTSFDADQTGGAVFLVMEYVAGEDLASLVKADGPLSPAAAIDAVLQAARGLEYAHQQGVVHRDIKPANLLKSDAGVIKILDMGLARISDPTGVSDGALTNTGTMMGTVDYMSPEQALDTRTADAQSDIYSLGCTLYYLLTGQPLFTEPTMMKRLLAHRETPAPSLATHPVLSADCPQSIKIGLDRIFQKMVAKQPTDRYASMTEVIQALGALQRGVVPATPVVSKPYRANPVSTLPADTVASASAQLAAKPPAVELPTIVATTVEGHRRRTPTVTSAKKSRRMIVLAVGSAGLMFVVIGLALWTGGKTAVPNRDDVQTAAPVVSGVAAASLAAPVVAEDPLWPRGPDDKTWLGIVAQPTPMSGIKRWQVEVPVNRSMALGLKWSPQNDRLAIASSDLRIRIYRWEDNQLHLEQIIPLSEHELWGNQLTWSTDGNWLAWRCYHEPVVRTWNAVKQRWGPQLPTGADGAMVAGWNDDSSVLATSGSDAGGMGIFLWDWPSGKLLRAMRGHEHIPASAWSPDGQYLMGYTAHELRIWKVDGTPHYTLAIPLLQKVSWHPTENRLAVKGQYTSGSSEVQVRVIDLNGVEQARFEAGGLHQILDWINQGTALHVESLDNTQSRVWRLSGELALAWKELHFFSARPGHNEVLSGYYGQNLFDPLTGLEISRISSIGASASDWSADGSLLASVDGFGGLLVWDADERRTLATLSTGQVYHDRVQWNPQSTSCATTLVRIPWGNPPPMSLAFWTSAGQLQEPAHTGWGLKVIQGGWYKNGDSWLGQLVRLNEPLQIVEIPRGSLSLDEGSQPYLSGEWDLVSTWPCAGTNQVIIVEVKHGTNTRRLKYFPHGFRDASIEIPVPDAHGVNYIVWNATGSRFALVLDNGAGVTPLEIWESSRPSRLSQAPAGIVSFESLLSPDGQYLIASHPRVFRELRADTCDEISMIARDADNFQGIADSPDSRYLAVGQQACSVEIFERRPFVPRFDLPCDAPTKLDWSGNGALIAAGTRGASLRVWDAQREFAPMWTGVILPDDEWASFSASGKLLHASPDAQRYLMVFCEKDDGTYQTLTYEQFLRDYKNLGSVPE